LLGVVFLPPPPPPAGVLPLHPVLNHVAIAIAVI
jgi:hypothetical protein